jgi:PAT family beta-lactamase induction signal transducer AmpG|tara:strand:+ start:15307 stop:16512 length:1206 start_codon:yes stop_codon:yes gene_type:complete
MLICIFTGFASGLPLYILFQLVPAWLRTEGVGLKEIGFFSLIQLPYAWKFVWAPLMDRYSPLPLGRRRSWMLITQVLLLIFVASLGFFSPTSQLSTIAALSVAVALFSATQDVTLDAYRRELLPDEELGLGNSIHVQAYRIAGLVPGALSLILADIMPWQSVFMITSAFMLLGVGMTLVIKEVVLNPTIPKSFRDSLFLPFQDFSQRLGGRGVWLVLAFLFFYKLGDNMAVALATPFYIDLGFSLTEIGIIAKNAALWPSIVGGLLGGVLMIKIGINRALWLFGFVQIITIFGFAILAEVGNNAWVLATVIAMEYLGVGLGTAAITAFMARATNPVYAATQLALLTALATVPRTFSSALSGVLVESMGWTTFYLLCAALAVPGMLLLFKVAPWNERPTLLG